MSATDRIQRMRPMPVKKEREFIEKVLEEYSNELGWQEPPLSAAQFSEPERRAAEARAHPERCRPTEKVFADIEKQFRKTV